MSLVSIICILLALQLLEIQAASSKPQTAIKSSKIDSNLNWNYPNFSFQGNSSFHDFSPKMPPKIPEKRNLDGYCTNNRYGCETCSTTNTDLCETCDDDSKLPDVDGGCTISSLANCVVVSSEYICRTCSDNYYRDCPSCSSLIPNCYACDDYKTCWWCLEGYFLDADNTCEPCQSPCATCDEDSNDCISCLEGYDSFGPTCTHCSDISDDCIACYNSQCTKCVDGKLPNELKTCTVSSISHCDQVDSTNGAICKLCSAGYYWSSPACEPCSNANIPHCDTCNNDGITCDVCSDDYYWGSNSLACVSSYGCWSWEYWNRRVCVSTHDCLEGMFWTGDACITCDFSNCEACRINDSQQPMCIKCKSDYILDDKYICQAYTTPVQNCFMVDSTNYDECILCDAGHYFYYRTGSCAPCEVIFPNCMECGEGCVKCKPGYNLNIDYECIPTISIQNCDMFKDEKNCAICSFESIPICSSFGSSIYGCKYSNKDGSQCLECNTGYTLSEDGACICGRSHCAKCNENDGAICDECENYYKLGENGECVCPTMNADNTICLASCNQLCTDCRDNDRESCTACVNRAELRKDKCFCTANSSYDEASSSCICNSEYQLVNDKCISCKSYLDLSDVIDAYFDSSFSAIIVEFGVKIDITVSPECSNTIDYQSIGALGSGAICTWDGSNKLKIKLGKGFTIRAEKLYLQGVNIVKNEGICNYFYTQLYILVKQTADPTPTAIISGPLSYSLDCGNADLQYSGSKSNGNLNNTLAYGWSATINPQNSDLISYINKLTSSSISIPNHLFASNIDASLVITLKVTNVYGSTDSISMTTKVKITPALQVVFDSGINDTIKSSESKTYKASVSQFCDSTVSLLTWEWAYVALEGAPSIKSSTILSASKQSNKLVINKNMLPSGYSYQFNASATSQSSSSQESVTGYSLLTIKVTSSPLKIKLSKSSCTLSSKDGFSINGDGSYDPDNSTTVLSYKWSCLYTNNATSCLGTDNKDLVSLANTSSLLIPSGKMMPGASYDIKFVIRAGDRDASATITIEVSAANVASSSLIEIPYSDSKKSTESYYTLSTTGQISSGSKIKWTCNSTSIAISPDNLPMISIPPNNVAQGNSYKFSFTITEPSGNILSSYIIVNTNMGAVCDESVDIQPTSGAALETAFIISIDNCYDQDGQDYPLSYAYNDDWNSIEYVLGNSKDNSLSTLLFANSNTIKIKVCDQMSDCSTYQNKITVSKPIRRLEDIDYSSMYTSATLDPDNIPSWISLIASSATIDNTLFSKMWNDLQLYALSQESVSIALFKSFTAAILALSNQTNSMTPALYESFMNWLGNLVFKNSISINNDSNSILKIILSFSDGYLSFGHQKSSVTMPFETYLLTADRFLSNFMAYITADDLAGQSSLPNSDSTSSIQYGKIRNFPSSITNTSESFGFINVTFSDKIPIAESQVVNFKAITYNITDDYSPWFSVSYTTSGSYQDYQYTTRSEQYQSFNDDRYSVNISIPYYKNSTKGLLCVYFNTTTSKWEANGCDITCQEFETIKVSLTHFSLFRITEMETIHYDQPTKSTECGNYMVPYIIIIVSFSIGLLLMIISVCVDKSHEANLEKNKKIAPVTEIASSFRDQNITVTDVDKSAEEATKVDDSSLFMKIRRAVRTGEDKSIFEKALSRRNNNKDGLTVFPIGRGKKNSESDLFSKESYSPDKTKGNFRMLLEGHLIFGLVYYRKDLPRWRRVFVLLTVIILEFLGEGYLFWKFEDTDKGREISIQSILENYEWNYLEYTVLSVFIGAILEWIMIYWINAEKRKTINILALILGIAILIGSVIGIVLFNIEFCHNWSGYWAESFFWGILMEIFIVQIFYMLIRFATLSIKSKNANARIPQEKITI